MQKKTLRDYLLENNQTVEDCSKLTGLKAANIYKIWNGKKKPGYKAKKLIEIYTSGEINWN